MSTAVNLLILLANLAVFGLNLKLYTEALKDSAMNRRSKAAKETP